MTFAERLLEDRRRAVLLLLSTADGFALNEDVLARELARIRVGAVTRDDLRGLLAWLERQGLVTVERLASPAVEGELWAATATRAGRDVARGASHPGVAAPL
jgi:hypothetical protein